MADRAGLRQTIRRTQRYALRFGVPLVAGLAVLWFAGERVFLLLARKRIEGSCVGGVRVAGCPPQFDPAMLGRIEHGGDLVPGLRVLPNTCARYVRGAVNSLLGARFFQRSPLYARVLWRLHGRRELPADRCGVHGDAWDMGDHILRAGGTLVCETDEPVACRKEFAEQVKTQARIGDVVFFYFPGSEFNPQARSAGSGVTHAGVVIGSAGGGEPVVAHMFDGSRYGCGPPAVRYETLASMYRAITYRPVGDSAGPQADPAEYQYCPGDPLLFAKALFRPAY